MTHFLRDKNNNTIIDLEQHGSKDLHCIMIIKNFSRELLTLSADQRQEFIDDMQTLQEIRGVFWEVFKLRQKHIDEQTLTKFIEDQMKPIARKWNLTYLVD